MIAGFRQGTTDTAKPDGFAGVIECLLEMVGKYVCPGLGSGLMKNQAGRGLVRFKTIAMAGIIEAGRTSHRQHELGSKLSNDVVLGAGYVHDPPALNFTSCTAL